MKKYYFGGLSPVLGCIFGSLMEEDQQSFGKI